MISEEEFVTQYTRLGKSLHKAKRKYAHVVNSLTRFGTETPKVSGPVGIVYFKHPVTDKRVIVLSDIHVKGEECTEENVPHISQYIDQLDIDKIGSFDLFVEHRIPHTNILRNSKNNPRVFELNLDRNPENHMTIMQNFANENYNKYKFEYSDNSDNSDVINKRRVHFFDIRDEMPFFYTFHLYTKVRPYFSKTRYTPRMAYTHFLQDFLYELQVAYASLNTLEYTTSIPVPLHKEASFLNEKFPDEYNKMMEFLEFIMVERLFKILKEEDEDMDEEYINALYTQMQYASAALTDFYTVARILIHDEFRNNIIYCGEVHTRNYIAYFLNLGFQMVHESRNHVHGQFRCLTIPIQFETFFDRATTVN